MSLSNLDVIADAIMSELDERDTVREIAIKSSRAIIRMSGNVVHSMHRDEDTTETMAAAIEEADRLRCLLDDHPGLWNSGLVGDAMQELSEAAIMASILRCEPLPSPWEISVPPKAYIMGLADCVGELRRFALEALRRGDVPMAEEYLETMEDIFKVIIRFDYPDAIVAIRRKQDIARSLLEKTRGEVAVAVNNQRLQDLLVRAFDVLE